jgi:hypothetical protein
LEYHERGSKRMMVERKRKRDIEEIRKRVIGTKRLLLGG